MEHITLTSQEEVMFAAKFASKMKLGFMLYGEAGVGKTAGICSYGKQTGKPVIVVAMSTYTSPMTIVGKVQQKDREGNLQWVDSVPPWFPCYRWLNGEKVMTSSEAETTGLEPVYTEEGKVIPHDAVILFDEINQTELSVQGWLLTAILEKVISGNKMTENTEFLAAANPKESPLFSSVVKKLNPALGGTSSSRFIPFYYVPSENSFAKYFCNKQKTLEEIDFPEETTGYISENARAFMDKHCGVDFHPMENTCPRTVEEFFKGLGELENLKNKTMQLIARAMLGEKNFNVLLDYVENMDAWNGKDILAGVQKIHNFGELMLAKAALTRYISSVDGKLSDSEFNIWGLLVAEPWKLDKDGKIASIRDRITIFDSIFANANVAETKLRNPINELEAKATAKKKVAKTNIFG